MVACSVDMALYQNSTKIHQILGACLPHIAALRPGERANNPYCYLICLTRVDLYNSFLYVSLWCFNNYNQEFVEYGHFAEARKLMSLRNRRIEIHLVQITPFRWTLVAIGDRGIGHWSQEGITPDRNDS